MKHIRLFCVITAVALAIAVFGCTKIEPTQTTEQAMTAAAEFKAPTVAAESEQASSQKAEAAEITVNVTIDGSQGEDKAISASEELKLSEGATAYDALQSLCQAQGFEITGDPSYVKTIGGLGEGSFGAAPCGWMFMVDGEYPVTAADQCELKDGSELVWEFMK